MVELTVDEPVFVGENMKAKRRCLVSYSSLPIIHRIDKYPLQDQFF